MARTPKYEAFVSPAGLAVFPWLNEPDTQHVKTGVFKVDVSVPFKEAGEAIAKLQGIRDAFIETLPVAKQRALTPVPVYKEELTRPEYPENATDAEKQAIRDAFVGEPTGNVLFRFKMNRLVTPQGGEAFEQSPVIVSADTGEAITDPVYAGSLIRAKGQVVPYTAAASGTVGVTLRLKAVQVIDLVTGSGGSSFWTDFEAE